MTFHFKLPNTFTRTDGTTSGVYDAVFGNDQTNTVYRGESGQAAWAGPKAIDVKGFGRITNLAVATANDFGLAKAENDNMALYHEKLA